MSAKIFQIDAMWNKKIKPSKRLLQDLKEKNIKKIALFSSVQFEGLDEFIQMLESEGIEVKRTKARRASNKGQVLGCDCYPDSFEEEIIRDSDAVVYVGDGSFHPRALLFSQMQEKRKKEIYVYDPTTGRVEVVDRKESERILIRRVRNIRFYLNSEKIGILVTTKPGQSFAELAVSLKKKIESQNKKAYLFLANDMNMQEIENFPFIDCFVNSACPRIAFEDSLRIEKPIINIKEAFNPTEELEKITSSLEESD